MSEALAGGELDFLQDRVLQIEVMDLALDYRLTLDRGKLAAAAPGSAPDVRFGGRSREFLLLALNEEDPDTLFFQRRLQLEGDTELGLEIKNRKRPRIHTCFPDLTPCRLSPEISRHRRNRWTCLMPPKARHSGSHTLRPGNNLA
ncbi:ubiquinone anaerobic biosynthesis accessory factor UbiT [Thiolapillus sp.]|uniref:ubiquinone anaerobic biosynthesis accessory factor UbiT n=1 Tax=Thiolapillus sp. TaxID=2017437 RepID=UPI003AF872D6